MALRVGNVEHFHDVLRDIEKQPDGDRLLEKFEESIKYLHHYNSLVYYVDLFSDFAKWSFCVCWVTRKSGHTIMRGGLIYHPGNRGDADNSLSVDISSLNGPQGARWSIHT